MSVFIGTLENELLDGVIDFPPFLRVNQLSLYYTVDEMPIEGKCNLFLDALNQLKSLLENTNTVYFDGRIVRYDECCFDESSQLLSHLTALSCIFSHVNRYIFRLSLWSEEHMDGYIIERFLNVPQVLRCTNVEINISCTFNPTILPIDAISNWLHYNYNGKSRFLSIGISAVQNAVDICTHLRNVKISQFSFLNA